MGIPRAVARNLFIIQNFCPWKIGNPHGNFMNRSSEPASPWTEVQALKIAFFKRKIRKNMQHILLLSFWKNLVTIVLPFQVSILFEFNEGQKEILQCQTYFTLTFLALCRVGKMYGRQNVAGYYVLLAKHGRLNIGGQKV